MDFQVAEGNEKGISQVFHGLFVEFPWQLKGDDIGPRPATEIRYNFPKASGAPFHVAEMNCAFKVFV